MSTGLTDEQSLNQLVGTIVDRRDKRELRMYPRFPLDVTQTERSSNGCMKGFIVLEQTPESGLSDLPGKGKGEDDGTGDDSLNHISIIDYSEGGLQVELAYDNLMDLIGKPIKHITIEVNKLRIPVSFRWFEPNKKKSRAGLAFEKSISCSSDTATLLVKLSEVLLDSLTNELLHMSTEDKYRYSYYVLLIFLSNLRFKLIQSFANYFEVSSLLTTNIVYSSIENRNCGILLYQEIVSKQSIFREITVNDSRFKDSIRMFMNPYWRYGCAVPTKGDPLILLKKEVVGTLARTVVIPSGKSLPKGTSPASLESPYMNLMRLHAVVPEIVEGIEADKQLHCYSRMIDSINEMTEKAIDRLSGSQWI